MCPNCFSFRCQLEGCPDCGYVPPAGAEGAYVLPSQTLLGNRYLIGRVLGIGGFGITYKAYDTLYREVCAVKEFAPSGLICRRPGECRMQIHGSADEVHYRHGIKRFMEEAQMLKRLEGIPSVVQVKECFQENGTAYFAMEFLDGTNLKKVVKAAGGTIDSRDIIRIVAEIGRAMGAIHRVAGILHRDISPENIYLLKDGTVKLLDFGSARRQTQDENQEFSVEFKHGFAPPEQYTRTGRQGTYTDVYALASTCYYSLTGIMVPDAMDRLDGRTYVPLHEARPDVTREASEAVDRALELDYRKRTQTMEEFIGGICPDLADANEARLSEKKRIPYLEVISGARAGVRWNLPEDTWVRIGRSPRSSNIVIAGDPMVSKVHCSIVYDSSTEEFLLQDLSSNGVFVDGGRIPREQVLRYRGGVSFSLASRSCMIKAGVSYE